MLVTNLWPKQLKLVELHNSHHPQDSNYIHAWAIHHNFGIKLWGPKAVYGLQARCQQPSGLMPIFDINIALHSCNNYFIELWLHHYVCITYSSAMRVKMCFSILYSKPVPRFFPTDDKVFWQKDFSKCKSNLKSHEALGSVVAIDLS